MKRALTLWVLLVLSAMSPALAAGKWVATPYAPARVVFDFYLDDLFLSWPQTRRACLKMIIYMSGIRLNL